MMLFEVRVVLHRERRATRYGAWTMKGPFDVSKWKWRYEAGDVKVWRIPNRPFPWPGRPKEEMKLSDLRFYGRTFGARRVSGRRTIPLVFNEALREMGRVLDED